MVTKTNVTQVENTGADGRIIKMGFQEVGWGWGDGLD
jgi:hypothetical protein